MFMLKRWTQIGTRTGRARSPVFPGPPRSASPWPSSRTRACTTPRTSPPAVRRRAAADLQTASSSPSKKAPVRGPFRSESCESDGPWLPGEEQGYGVLGARGSGISSPSDCRRSHFGCQRQFWPIGVSRRPQLGARILPVGAACLTYRERPQCVLSCRSCRRPRAGASREGSDERPLSGWSLRGALPTRQQRILDVRARRAQEIASPFGGADQGTAIVSGRRRRPGGGQRRMPWAPTRGAGPDGRGETAI